MPTLDVAIDPTRAVQGSRVATRAVESITGATGRLDRSVTAAESRMRRFGRTAATAGGQIRGMLGVFGGALGVRAIVGAADNFQTLQNRVRTTTESHEILTLRMERLAQVAQRTRGSLDGVITLYQRGALAADELGASSSDLITFVERVGEALAIEGKSAVSARGALIQLGQALGTGIVRAEEFNSILEGAPSIARAAARGIIETGGSVAKLRQFMLEGRVTSEVFFRGILAGSDNITKKFEETEVTLAQATTRLSNEFTLLAGQVGEGGLLAALRDVVDFLATGLRAFRDFEGGLTATEQAARSVVAGLGAAGLTGILAGLVVFLGPVGALTVGLVSVAAGFIAWAESTDTVTESHRQLNQELGGVARQIAELRAEAESLTSATDKAIREQLRLAAAGAATRELAKLQVREDALAKQISAEGVPQRNLFEQFFSGASAGEARPPTGAEKELMAVRQGIQEMTKTLENIRDGVGFSAPQGPPPPGFGPGGGNLAPGAVSLTGGGGGGVGAAGGALGFGLIGANLMTAMAQELAKQITADKIQRELEAAQFGQDVGNAFTDPLRQALFDRNADLKDIAENFATGLVSAFAEALVFRPLQNLIANAASTFFLAAASGGGGGGGGGAATGGGGGVGFGGSFLTPPGFARGGAFGGGRVLTKPTMFALGGSFGIAGEAGPEAALPLKKLRGGILGVNASGGGGPSVINYNTFNVRSEEHLRRTVRQVNESSRRQPGAR